jgi:two-component system OmpR family response regulator
MVLVLSSIESGFNRLSRDRIRENFQMEENLQILEVTKLPILKENLVENDLSGSRLKNTSSSVLIVTYDRLLAQFYKRQLIVKGFSVEVACDSLIGLVSARVANHSLLILDWLPFGVSCPQICRYLRCAGYDNQILVLTETDRIEDRIAVLNAGANDCMAKPIRQEELLARIRARLRRSKSKHLNFLRYQDLILNPMTWKVTRGKREIHLTPKEFKFLLYLILHCLHVLTRTQILEYVWSYDFSGDSNIIEVYIRSLRRKLEKNGEHRIIQTVRGVGYVMRSQ